MALAFYPHQDDVQKGSLQERVAVLMEAAEHFKAIATDAANVAADAAQAITKHNARPKDMDAAFNWEEVADVLSEIRSLNEATAKDKQQKAALLTSLAEVYEVLRAAKMSKLEAVRLALINEASQLSGGAGVG